MTAQFITPKVIAKAGGVTVKHVRRMIGRARGAGPYVGAEWFGCAMRVVNGENGLEVEFSTLPDHIREALVMQEQPELPFPPPP